VANNGNLTSCDGKRLSRKFHSIQRFRTEKYGNVEIIIEIDDTTCNIEEDKSRRNLLDVVLEIVLEIALEIVLEIVLEIPLSLQPPIIGLNRPMIGGCSDNGISNTIS
jgi:hypothetical protein